MTVREMAERLELKWLVPGDGTRPVTGGYCGDLLSWVMGRAQEGDAWFTVMGNVNAIAVAVLADTACLVLTEDSPLDDDARERALSQEVAVLGSGRNAFQLAAALSRLLDGEFLPYRKANPQQVTTTISLNTRDLIDAVERASLVINDRIKSPLVCDFHDDEIQISCTTPLGSVNDVIPAKIEGDSEEMGYNSRFLLDALKNTETDEVRIELGGALSPMKVLPPEGESFLFLVLPVRLKK